MSDTTRLRDALVKVGEYHPYGCILNRQLTEDEGWRAADGMLDLSACDCGLAERIDALIEAAAAEARAGLVGVEALRRDHRPVPFHWSQSGESGTVCYGSVVGLHHRVERWPCDVESAILAALAATTPAPEAVERAPVMTFAQQHGQRCVCGRDYDSWEHVEGTADYHPFTPTTPRPTP